jgi:hypothetical protein
MLPKPNKLPKFLGFSKYPAAAGRNSLAGINTGAGRFIAAHAGPGSGIICRTMPNNAADQP